MTHTVKQDGFPDPIDNQGRWCRKDGKMYRASMFVGGNVRWVPEGSVMYSGPVWAEKVTRVWRLRYTAWHQFVEWLRGGPLEVE